MTEESKRWGDRIGVGCFAIVLIGLGLGILGERLNPKQKRVDVRVTGQMQGHLFADPTLTLTVWHQHEGDLKNGRLTVSIKRPNVPEEDATHVHSFERWSPNQQNAVTFEASLPNYDPAKPMVVEVWVKAANARDTLFRPVWQNGSWKE